MSTKKGKFFVISVLNLKAREKKILQTEAETELSKRLFHNFLSYVFELNFFYFLKFIILKKFLKIFKNFSIHF